MNLKEIFRRGSDSRKGVILITLTIILAASVISFEKSILKVFAPEQTGFLIFSGGLFSLPILIRGKREPIKVFKKNKNLILTIGFLTFLRGIFWWWGMDLLQLSELGFLGKSEVLFTVILGVIFIGERFIFIEILFLILAIIGIFLISFKSGDFPIYGVSATLLAQFFMAIQSMLVRKKKNIDPFVLAFWRSLLASLFFIPYLLVLNLFHFSNLLWVILALADGFVAVFLMRGLFFYSLKYFPAGKVSIFFSVQAFLVLIFGKIFYGDILSISQLLGGIILILSVIGLIKFHKPENAK